MLNCAWVELMEILDELSPRNIRFVQIPAVLLYDTEHLVKGHCLIHELNTIHVDKVNDHLVSPQSNQKLRPFQNEVFVLVHPVKHLLH